VPLARFGVAMEEHLLRQFDALVAARGQAANRSGAVHDLVRDALVDAEWESSPDEVVATVTTVFGRGHSDVSEKLDSLQHSHHDRIVSAMHVHLDAHDCLEVLAVRGAGAEVRGIANGLLGTKGVKHGGVVTTTTGKQL
jgi:CopG family nickel-responsive transcriptional regulator